MKTQKTEYAPNFQTLDEYGVDLLNEKPPRHETVVEIQDGERGQLLCYANPELAAFIVTACNSHAANQARIAELEAALADATAALSGLSNSLLSIDHDYNRTPQRLAMRDSIWGTITKARQALASGKESCRAPDGTQF